MAKIRDTSVVRDPIRESDEIREDIRADEGERVRRRKGGQIFDKFHIPAELIPDGMSVEWKRHTVVGKTDYHYDRELYDQGWRPVQHSMFPGMFAPKGAEGVIVQDDMILMERPAHLTNEARIEDYNRAHAALRAGEFRLGEAPEGTAPRARPQVRSTVEPMQVPE